MLDDVNDLLEHTDTMSEHSCMTLYCLLCEETHFLDATDCPVHEVTRPRDDINDMPDIKSGTRFINTAARDPPCIYP